MTTCEACGGVTTPGGAFCHHCGHRLNSAQAQRGLLAEHRRERKWVTILFADLRRSLQLIAHADPEKAQELLSEVIGLMREAVDSHGGVVNKVSGDGIMALFGAPLGTEDHAVRACGAALSMIELLRSRAASDDEAGSSPVEVRVGVNTGEVFVHPTAEYGSVAYDATGAAVHVASRMEQCAGPNEVYLTAETLAFAAGAVEVRDLGLVGGKGTDAPIKAFQLLRVSTKRPARRPRHAGGLTTFVNRATEFRILGVLREQVERGVGTVIRLTGDAGCGKTRLVDEFAATLPTDRWAIYRCQASERHRRTGYRAVADVLEGVAGVDFTDPAQLRKERLERGMARLSGKTSAEDRQALAVLAGLSEGDVGWRTLEPRERRRRIESAVGRLLDNLSHRQPTLFVIEDAHWLDEESAAQFARFFESAKDKQVLAIVTTRGDFEVEATRLPTLFDCQIQPLSRDDAGTMLHTLLRRGRGVAELEERLLDLTQGNPLFIEECLYSLVDNGAVTHDGEAYALVEPTRELRVPPSIRGLLASRVDRISDRDKDVLQAASVLGLALSRDLLCALVDIEETQVQESLDRLCRDGFLIARPDPMQFAFRHGLTREAVYESIPIRRRAVMHARLMELIERWDGDHVELLAHHAIRANAFDKAADYCRRSGSKAFQHDAKEEAVRFFRRGLDMAGRWPAGPEKDCALFDLHVDLRNPLFQLARIDELAEHMAAAKELAARLHDPVRLGRYYPYLSHLAWFRGDSSAALDAVRLTSEIAASQDDAALHIRAKFQEGLIWLSQSRCPETVRALNDVLAYLESHPQQEQYGLNTSLAVTALSYVSRVHADRGDTVGARNTAEQAIAIARKLKNPFSSAFAFIGLGYHHLREGRCADAIPWLRRAVEISDTGEPLMIPVAAGFLGWALVDAGRAEEGLVFAERAVRKADEIGFRVFQPVRLGLWAHALAASQRIDEAIQRADEAIRMAQLQHEFGAEAYARKELGRCLRIQAEDREKAEQATAMLEEGRKLATEFGLQPLVQEIDRLNGTSVSK